MHCGECHSFKYEDIDGYGLCSLSNTERHCGDKCDVSFDAILEKNKDILKRLKDN